MLKAYKYRLYPNKEQIVQIEKTFGSCRFVYNQLLAKKIALYKNEQKSMSKTDCNNYCNRELKKPINLKGDKKNAKQRRIIKTNNKTNISTRNS